MDMKSLFSTKRRKMLIASIVMLAIACTATAAYAEFIVTSNIVEVTRPAYTVQLSIVEDPTILNTVDLNATVTSTSPVVGLTVTFWTNATSAIPGPETWTSIGTSLTNSSGNAWETYTVIGSGPWDFEATVNAPFTFSG